MPVFSRVFWSRILYTVIAMVFMSIAALCFQTSTSWFESTLSILLFVIGLAMLMATVFYKRRKMT